MWGWVPHEGKGVCGIIEKSVPFVKWCGQLYKGVCATYNIKGCVLQLHTMQRGVWLCATFNIKGCVLRTM